MKDASSRICVMRKDVLVLILLSLFVAGVLLYAGFSSVLDAPDYLSLHLLHKIYLKESLLAGELPFWNPYQVLGRPFLADIEAAIFYPTAIFFVLLPPDVALFLSIASHLFIASVFMFRLSLYFHGPRLIAYFCALAFLFSGAFCVRLQAGQLPCFQAIALMPWIIYAAIKIQERYSAGSIIQLVFVLALSFLAGHPQYFWINCLGLGLFVLGRRFSLLKEGNFFSFLKDGLMCLFALGLCFGVTALQFLPALEFLSQTVRNASVTFSIGQPLSLLGALSLFLTMNESIWINWNQYFHVGFMIVPLGVAGLLYRPDKNMRGLLCLVVGTLLMASGANTPLFEFFNSFVPGYELFRYPVRAAIWLVPAFILGAGSFLSHYQERSGFLEDKYPLGIILLTIIVFFLASAGANVLGEMTVELSMLLLGLVLFACCPRAGQGRVLKQRLVRLFVVSVLVTNVLNVFTMKTVYFPAPMGPKEDLLVAYLEKNKLLEENAAPPRVLLPTGPIRTNSGMLHGFSSVNYFGGLQLTRTWHFLHSMLGIDAPTLAVVRLSDEIFDKGPFPYKSLNLSVGIDRVENVLVLQEDPDPRVFLANSYTPVQNWQEALSLMKQGHAFKSSPLVENEIDLNSSGMRANIDSARITYFGQSEIRVDVNARERSLLVLGEAWYPGWNARVENQKLSVFPVNVWQRGVLVPAGKYELVIFYSSNYFPWGLCLSIITLFGLSFVGLRKRVLNRARV